MGPPVDTASTWAVSNVVRADTSSGTSRIRGPTSPAGDGSLGGSSLAPQPKRTSAAHACAKR